ncbi:MAG: glucose 1-dehydrogenase [Pseudomonadota bacterium]
MGRLTGKTALVTGGASGIGRGIAERFCAAGAQVFISDVDAAGGEAVADQLGCRFLLQDVVDEARWEDVLTTVTASGPLDVLVNNAGIFFNCPVERTPLDDWRRVLDVNLTGVFLGCKHAVAAMKAAGRGGSIINLSSVVGQRGQLGGAAYSASKGGVRLLTKTVAVEAAGDAIRCNSVHPGVIDTPIMDPIFAAADNAAERRRQIESRLPLGYMGDAAQDVGNLAVYLASDESRYITGAELVVDGGMTVGLPA